MTARVEAPVIGLSTYREPARWLHWDASADLLPTTYAASVEAVGGVAVLLPPSRSTAARAVVSRLDGLVITGGSDVAPQRYGEAPHPTVTRTREDRDAWELSLLDAADEAGLPVLGVCRGMQVMAVHAGGSLVQHVPEVLDGATTHNPGADTYGSVSIAVAERSSLAAMVGQSLQVHCHHHQAVAAHPGFEAVAWAEDGLLEGMERPGGRYCVGVQWHPEIAVDAGLFAALVAAAAAYRG